MKKKILVAVAWPYVNGDLHVGHLAGYLLPADIFARFHRMIGNEVLMVSGSDCYGTPITVEADKKNTTPEAVVDLYHPHHLRLFEQYGISFDLFTKTTTENHTQVVQDMLIQLAKHGYIYKATTQQYFGEKENKFLPDRYVEGECPHCAYTESRGDQCDNCGKVLESGELKKPKSKLSGSSVVLKETDHLFLDWMKLEPYLRTYTQKAGKQWKKWILSEAQGWLSKGLKPRAITRDITWGVPIPNEKLPKEVQLSDVSSKRIYVWFDAVIGYLSASIEWSGTKDTWRQYWYPKNPEEVTHVYFMGKDNLVFHTLFWPGQLYGYDKNIHSPDIVSINQFLNFGGQKFSKSRNVVVDSAEMGNTYGVDSVRFYLSYIMPENSDASFSWADYYSFHNNILIGSFGNFINRVLTLAKEMQLHSVDAEVVKQVETFLTSTRSHLERCEFKLYAQKIIEFSQSGNKRIDTSAPWKHKKDSVEYQQAVTNGMGYVIGLIIATSPLIPKTSQKIAEMLNITLPMWPNDTPSAVQNIASSLRVCNITPLFSKIESTEE